MTKVFITLFTGLLLQGMFPVGSASETKVASASQLATASSLIQGFAWEDDKGRLHRDWRERQIWEKTEYRLVEHEGQTVLRAEAQAEASALYQNLPKIPAQDMHLTWSWQAQVFPENEAMLEKDGNDHAAIVFVIFDKAFLLWRTKAILYVWSEHLPEGTTFTNPYAKYCKVVVAQSGTSPSMVTETRDLAADYRELFGEEPERIEAVGVMTDADNTASRCVSLYGAMELHEKSR